MLASNLPRPASESAACADSASVMLKCADMLTPSLATDASPILIVTVPSVGMLTESLLCADSEIVAISDALPVPVSVAPADSLSVALNEALPVAESTPVAVSLSVSP